MSEWVFWSITTAVGLGIGTISFFLKRTLDQLEKNQKTMADSMTTSIKEFKEMTSESMEKFQKQITEEQTKIIQKIENKDKRFWDQHDRLKDEFYKFREHVASSYTKQEDFASETRDINNKLDKVYGAVMQVQGLMKGSKGDQDE